jgi:hypothetical protein
MRRPSQGLVPLRSVAKAADRAAEAEARIEARLRRSWLLVVGATLVNQTRLLRAHRGTLVVGCWHAEVIPSLRQSAQETWPQIQARLERLWKLSFQRLEIVPCDPPEPVAPSKPPREVDAFDEVLKLFREQAKGGWTPRRK